MKKHSFKIAPHLLKRMKMAAQATNMTAAHWLREAIKARLAEQQRVIPPPDDTHQKT